jgi:hypothetical protein
MGVDERDMSTVSCAPDLAHSIVTENVNVAQGTHECVCSKRKRKGFGLVLFWFLDVHHFSP